MTEIWELFPLQAPAVTCGLRADLPKKQRRHDWCDLGEDVRNFGSRGFCTTVISACTRCGKDQKGPAIDEDDSRRAVGI
jgi:hypothetical protein